jgi:hypothetical protein
MSSQDWNIKTRGAACSATGNAFEDGTTIYSRLIFGEEGYGREDYSETEWNEKLRDSAVSVWKSIFHAPPPAAEEPLKKETVESLLRQLIETDDLANRSVIFILSVMLERKRILVERDVHHREDGVKVRVYEHKKTGETFLIPDPELKLSELEDVQAQVMERLGIPPPGSEATPSGDESTTNDKTPRRNDE